MTTSPDRKGSKHSDETVPQYGPGAGETVFGDGVPGGPTDSVAQGPTRFQMRRLLGRGGMGEVWEAWDPLVGRAVALKFLKLEDPSAAARFLREVRTQARVEHPHICRVYEVGERDGRPYIAMQKIDGRPLDEAAREMTVEQMAKLAAEVADALHAAHRQGLIHRDVKPSNILVSRREDGGFAPWVVDFGLAVDLAGPRMTIAGLVSGTPAYMSPEQARGESERLDRRTDVYSLGATLYEVIAGRLPFGGASAAEVMKAVLDAEPVPLRALRGDVPSDLETIIGKCLEKDPSKRYDSARALAEDLHRFLDGEPIAARRVPRAALLVRRARKHKFATAVVAASLAATLVAGGLGLQTRLASARQQDLARRLGQEVEQVEWLVREARLLPLHDTSEARRIVRDRLDWIEKVARQEGRAASAPAEWALGRGHLALGEIDPALEHLEKAWATGFRSPGLSWALGRALGEKYSLSLRESDRIIDPDIRQARRADLRRKFREPALARLKESLESPDAVSSWVEGLIAFYEERHADALGKAEAACRQRPGLFEALQLAGDVHASLGRLREEKGEIEEALAEYAAAGKSYAAGLAVGRSDSALWHAECRRLLGIAELEGKRGRETDEHFGRARAACDAALAAVPGFAPALDASSRIEWRWADSLSRRGDVTGSRRAYEESVRLAQSAAEADPLRASTHSNLGIALWGLAQDAASAGRDPRPFLEPAARALHEAKRLEPASSVTSDLGSLLLEKAMWESSHGIDPETSLAEAIKAGEEAVSLIPKRSAVHSNLGNAYYTRASLELRKGADPKEPARRARECYEKAIELNPKNANPRNNLGEVWLLLAEDALVRGGNPQGALENADARFTEALERNPRLAEAYRGRGSVRAVRARALLESRGDPLPALLEARTEFEKALSMNAQHAATFARVAALYRREAAFELDRGKDARRALESGLSSAKQALSIDPNLAAAKVELGWLRALEARRSPTPQPIWQEARQTLEAALAADPFDPAPFAALVEISRQRMEKALSRADVAEARRALEEGKSRLAAGLALNPLDLEMRAARTALEALGSRVRE